MATSSVAVVNNANYKSWNIIATADGDTTLVIAHGFGAIPDAVFLTPLTAAGRLSDWIAATDATNITLTKTTVGSSGAAPAQLKVVAMRPHSIFQ